MQIPTETEPGVVQGGHAQEPEIAIRGAREVEAAEEITEDIFRQMYLEHQGEEIEEPERDEQHPEDEAQITAAEVNLGEDAPVESKVSSDPRVDQLQGALAQIQAQLANLQNGSQQKPDNKPTSISAKLQELMPKAAPGVVDQFAQVVETVADAKYGAQLEQLTQAMNHIAGEVNRGRAREHSSSFDAKIDKLLDLNGVEKAEQREDIKDSILGRGWKRHGQKFDLQHVPLLFKEVLTNHRRFGHAKAESIMDEKERDMAATPPVATGETGSMGIKSLRDNVRNPSDRTMDFHGDKFSNIVSEFLGAVEKFPGKVVGRR